MKSKFIILVVAVALIAAACNKTADTTDDINRDEVIVNPNPSPTEVPTPAPTPAQTPSPTPTASPSSVMIHISSSGFSPNNLTVKSGTKVIFENEDTKAHWPASNPHPTHTDLPGFDAFKSLKTGEMYTYTFTKPGIWGFHDHNYPTLGGRITVE